MAWQTSSTRFRVMTSVVFLAFAVAIGATWDSALVEAIVLVVGLGLAFTPSRRPLRSQAANAAVGVSDAPPVVHSAPIDAAPVQGNIKVQDSVQRSERRIEELRRERSSALRVTALEPSSLIVESAAPTLTTELERLAALRQNGSLSDAEFRAAKSRLIGSA
jgi:hypothetical protein